MIILGMFIFAVSRFQNSNCSTGPWVALLVSQRDIDPNRSQPVTIASYHDFVPSFSISIMQQELKEKRQRNYHRKVRTGCLTCKVRHKKCDETRPTCLTCSSTGRKCDGYMDPSLKTVEAVKAGGNGIDKMRKGTDNEALSRPCIDPSSHRETSNLTPRLVNRIVVEPSLVDLTAHERYALHFFMSSGCFSSPTYFYDEFWCERIHNINAGHPAVKHATISFSACLLQFMFLNTGYPDKVKDLERFIVQENSKALSYALADPIAKMPAERCIQREVLMSMATVLSMQSLFHGEIATATTHFTYGLKAIEEWRSLGYDNSRLGPVLHHALESLRPKMIACSNPYSFLQDDNPALHQLPELEAYDERIQCSIEAFWTYWSWLISTQHPDGFSMGKIVDTFSPLAPREFAVMIKVSIRKLQLQKFIERIGESASPLYYDVLTLFGVWEHVMHARVRAAAAADEDRNFQPFQMRYDAAWKHFQQANEAADKLVQSLMRQKYSKCPFPVAPAIIRPLFFCGFYCREWTTRRDTLRILKTLEDWFRKLGSKERFPTKALERLIGIESEGLRVGDVVPRASRIHFTRVHMHATKMRLSYLRAGIPGFDDF